MSEPAKLNALQRVDQMMRFIHTERPHGGSVLIGPLGFDELLEGLHATAPVIERAHDGAIILCGVRVRTRRR